MLPSGILPASFMVRHRPDERRRNVKTLMDSITGAYLVTTVASTYLIDLDRLVIKRTPRTHHAGGSLLRRDDELVMLVELRECTVGQHLEMILDLRVHGVPGTFRRSTVVQSIEPVASPGSPLPQ